MKSSFAMAAIVAGAAVAGTHAAANGPGDGTADWTGVYFGIHGGYATGEWDGRLATTAGDPPPPDAGFSDPTQAIDGDGWLAGGQIGYNWQHGHFVTGLEADISWTGFDGSDTFTTDAFTPTFAKTHDLDIDYFGTARVRPGWAFANWLFYATGGLAWGETSGDLAVAYDPDGDGPEPVFGTSFADTDETHVGWTAGAGIEFLARGNWTIRAEWLYVDLGKEDYHFTGEVFNGDPFDTDSFPSDLSFHVFRVGLNYKFGG
ncbi:MAG: outer membrane protein [Alphaproteobacteria bacterium]